MKGECLGPCRLERELGSGGMGRVWRAHVTEGGGALDAGTVVAVKTVHPHLAARPEFLARFRREAEAGRRVVHPNVVRLLDAGIARADGEDVHYLVLEYVEGQTLRALLDDLGRVPEDLCRHVGREIARGLAAIHAARIVHRDVKPENVLITRDHVVKLMDLGVARFSGAAQGSSSSGAFMGSLHYAAPEQLGGAALRGAAADGRTDLHALGVVLYELATAVHPFRADDVAGVIDRVLRATPRRAGELSPQLSPMFEELLAQLLAKDRESRPASAGDVARILDEGEESAWWKSRAAAIRASTRRPLRRIRIPRETALHGRAAELAQLRALYQRAAAGEGQVALLEGEAGIGKSRLLDEFVAGLERQGEELHCLSGGYPPGGAATASGAFSTAYREQFGDEGAQRWLAPTPLLVPAFDALLRGEPSPAGAEPLTKDSLQTCFVHATRALAADRATIVLIDDLHFAPQEGRALFAALALAIPGHRVLLIGTTRPSLDERWLAQADGFGVARLTLPRLAPADLVRLLADALRSQHLAEELAGRIAVKSDGNPFFVFEILRGLREGRFLEKTPEGRWVTTTAIREIAVPESIRELVQSRVAELDDASRNLLDVAACVGYEFDPAVVGEVAGMGRIPALQCLARVEKRHRLVRAAGRRYVFDHHQVQEHLYAGLHEQLREGYHAAIGSVLETRHGAAAADPQALDGALCVALAEHFAAGAQGASALRYLDAALTHLEANYANDAAIRLAGRVLAAPGLVAGAGRCELLLRRAARLDLLGRREEERKDLEEARSASEGCANPALRARERQALALFLYATSSFDEAATALDEALAAARDSGDRDLESVLALDVARVLWSRGRNEEAREHLERALTIVRERGDRRHECQALNQLGPVLETLGRRAEAQVQLETSLALSRAMGDRAAEARAVANLGVLYGLLGREDESMALAERSIELYRETGFRSGEATATGTLGRVFATLDRFAEAVAYLERSIALHREVGDRKGESVVVGNLGLAYASLGRFEAALEHHEARLALCRDIGFREGESLALLNIARAFEGLGDLAAAERSARESIALGEEIGNRHRAETGGLCLGSLRALSGDLEGARAALVAARDRSSELGCGDNVALALCHLAVLPGGDAAAALSAVVEHESRLNLERCREARLLLFRATGDRRHLEEAKRLLDAALPNVPEEHRTSFLEQVRVNREIAAAAREAAPAP